MLVEGEPVRNYSDPISGFTKYNFVKKINVRSRVSNLGSCLLLEDVPEESGIYNLDQKKLQPMFKPLS